MCVAEIKAEINTMFNDTSDWLILTKKLQKKGKTIKNQITKNALLEKD